MKQKIIYDQVLDVLKNVKPGLNQPGEFTGYVLEQVAKQRLSKQKGIESKVNSGQWNIFIGFRAAMAVAAVFLVGFFGYQQWDMASKITSLEAEIHNQKTSTLPSKYMEIIPSANYAGNSIGKDSLTVNKKTINQLFKLLEQLKEENRSLKSEIIDQYRSKNKSSIKKI
jgi:hypothetical protein